MRGLEGRFFGGLHGRQLRESSRSNASFGSDEAEDEPIMTNVGDLLSKEDQYLTSANLCRWVINFSDISLEKQVRKLACICGLLFPYLSSLSVPSFITQIGVGSYGVVFKGTWKGVEVAVKRFIKQNMNERSLLEFRAEMAFLSEMHHPNIVLFIGTSGRLAHSLAHCVPPGACVRMPNLCLVMEYMGRGSLKDLLADKSIKMTWKRKLQLLKSAALGVNYLHSLQPCIIHRDLKVRHQPGPSCVGLEC